MTRILNRPGYLILEDGSWYQGTLFGGTPAEPQRQALNSAPAFVFGELVFNTAMSGYEEVLTDPSYKNQMVVMTSIHVGNYGITREDVESQSVHVAGFVVAELSDLPSNWRSRETLSRHLAKYRVVGISGVDTRSITKKLRSSGAMRAAIAQISPKKFAANLKMAVEAIRRQPLMEGLALADKVSVKEPSRWTPSGFVADRSVLSSSAAHRVAVWDFGIKWSILRHLTRSGLEPVIFPHHSSFEELLAINPSGIVLSNGPGDPAALTGVIDQLRRLLNHQQRPPILGICLGHQLLSLACGGKTFKMKFGHHGVNHPVQDVESRRVWISSHNHGFAVDPDSLPADVRVTFVSLNDSTVEGMSSDERRFLAVQFHPEAAPGPWEAIGIFQRFQKMVMG